MDYLLLIFGMMVISGIVFVTCIIVLFMMIKSDKSYQGSRILDIILVSLAAFILSGIAWGLEQDFCL